MRSGKLRNLKLARWAVRASVVLALVVLSGCTRGFYRRKADQEVQAILTEKDRFAQWKIEQYHVYPDPRARFADTTDPDRPPMPPDDPAARLLAPNPQTGRKEGIAWIEGTGYLNLLSFWDAQNRGERALEEMANKFSDVPTGEIRRVVLWQKEDKKDGLELSPVPRTTGETVPGLNQAFLVKLDQAVELGLINSREFQARREDLYLAALPVSLERFSFRTQFFAMEEAIRQRSGRESQSGYGNFWQFNSTLGFSRLFSTGGLLLASFANQTVLNLTGAERHTVSTSIINLDLIQPLLRGGGRAVTLEPLTQVERNLLYEIRSYARFRKEFFQYITGGSGVRPIQSLGEGVAIRGVGLAPGALSLGSGNPAQPQIRPGGVGQLDLGATFRASGQGYLPTLQVAGFLRNETKNVQALEGILKYFQAIEEGGDVSSLQVGQVQLALLRARTTVLQREKDLRDSLDQFKLQLGLPMPVPVELDDTPVLPVGAQLERFEDVINKVEGVIKEMTALDALEEAPQLRKKLRKLLLDSPYTEKATTFREKLPGRWADWEKLGEKALLSKLEGMRKERRGLLDRKSDYEEKGAPWPAAEQERFQHLDREIGLGELEGALRFYEGQPWLREKKDKDRSALHVAAFRDVRLGFMLVLGEASTEKLAKVRQQWPALPPLVVEGVHLLEDDLEKGYEVVTRLALTNRLDLLNARAQVVDTWRQLRIFANSLLGTFNVGYHVDSITPPGEAKPLAFSGTRTRQQLFLNADLPLVRIAERNGYRASLIAYQRARRELMSLEDQIAAQVREELRQLRFFAQTYRIQQQTVELAYTQVESSLEQFRAPPDPRAVGGGGGSTAGNAAALTQQLLQAQNNLPAAQNQLFSIWVNYHVFRQQLFLDLELMPLDYRGVWIDEHHCEPLPRLPEPGLERGPSLLPGDVVPSGGIPARLGLPGSSVSPLGDGGGPDAERHRARLVPPS